MGRSSDKMDTSDETLTKRSGPGASSMMGLFEEVGPCEFSSSDRTVPNPYSWAEYANLLFLE